MIPKIIHYCWFGRKPKPQEVLDYIETWKKYFPDFKIKEWNEDNFDFKSLKYTREAYVERKYAFVSDVCRLKALYEEGGVYFDTDIEVVGSFDDYLNLNSFVGFEVNELIGTGVIGAEKGTKWIQQLLRSYEDEDFINCDGIYNIVPNTIRLTRMMGLFASDAAPQVFPFDVFCAKHWETQEEFRTEKTVSIHHYKSSWVKQDEVHCLDLPERFLSYRLQIRNRHLLVRLYKKILPVIINYYQRPFLLSFLSKRCLPT